MYGEWEEIDPEKEEKEKGDCPYDGFYQAGTEICDFCPCSDECRKIRIERFEG